MNSSVHAHTPQLVVIDNRSLPVRQVTYWRRDIDPLIPEARVTAQQHDIAGRLVAQRDPRFLTPKARPNLATVYSLSGAVLFTDSIDAGWRLELPGESGQMQTRWDGRCSHWTYKYDEQQRLTAIHEQTQDSSLRIIECLTYADNSARFAERNQCGQLIRYDDTAGTLHSEEYGLLGELIIQKRHFLKTLRRPDWPLSLEARNELLEPCEGFQTRRRYSPLGELIRQVDARGHRQSWHFDRAGQLQQVHLQLKDDTAEKTLLHCLRYNARGQIESQTAGNGTTTSSQFDPASGRLLRLTTDRVGRGRLQALSYRYDAGGNVVELQDHTQPTRYFANQQVEAISLYTYDSLSQLISATGREALGQSIRPELPELMPDPGDSNRLLNYTEHYEYDQGGNLTVLRHESGHPGQAHRRAFKVAEDSNRALAWDEQRPPDFGRGFDASGNLQSLHPHDQRLLWTGQNQLQQITFVSRDGGENDAEYYVYDHQHLRVRKQQRSLASGTTHVCEVRYLPGLEIRTLDASEHLEVITVEAERDQVRCLHWVTPPPDDIKQDQLRYSLCDHLGSSALELDGEADIISHEGYYPYGGTAWWAARNDVEARYKTIRYSGKERDASGLYDYGLRYYAPWLCRWISPDPAGDVDGLNVYRMVRSNPLRYVDAQGQMADEPPLPPGLDFEGMTDEQRRNLYTFLKAKRDLENLVNTNPEGLWNDFKHRAQRFLATSAKTKLTSAGGALGGAVGGVIGGILNETTNPAGGSAEGGATAAAVGTAVGGIVGGIVGNLVARIILRTYNITIMGRIHKDIESSTGTSQENIELSTINGNAESREELEAEANRIREILEGPDDDFHDATQDTELPENTINAITEAIKSPELISALGNNFTVVDLHKMVGYRAPMQRNQPAAEDRGQPGYFSGFLNFFRRTPATSQ
ncbi:RHS repeat domain-containing protein [Pseudomonas sp. XS1P51]